MTWERPGESEETGIIVGLRRPRAPLLPSGVWGRGSTGDRRVSTCTQVPTLPSDG